MVWRDPTRGDGGVSGEGPFIGRTVQAGPWEERSFWFALQSIKLRIITLLFEHLSLQLEPIVIDDRAKDGTHVLHECKVTGFSGPQDVLPDFRRICAAEHRRDNFGMLAGELHGETADGCAFGRAIVGRLPEIGSLRR